MVAKNELTTRAYRKARAALRAQELPCWLCGRSIYYTLRWPDPGSFSLDHVIARLHGGSVLDPTNHAASHLHCNASRGAGQRNRASRPPVTRWTSRDW